MSEYFINKKCPKCGKSFFPTCLWAYKDDKGCYCSWACYNHRKDETEKKKKGKPPKRVSQYTLDGEYIRTFDSVKEVAAFLGCVEGTIRNACIGKIENALKFVWKYEN